MAYPPITSLGTVPQRTQTPAEFATNGDSFLGALPNFRTELNTFGAYVDSKGAEVDADAAAAANSALESANSASDSAASATLALSYKDLAAGTANFKGSWSSLTGSLAVPASAYHNGLTWVLLSNLANVTTAEPGISSSWVVASGDSYRRLVDSIFKRATLDLDFSANSHKVYEQFGLEPKQIQSAVVTTRNSTATYQSPTAIVTAAINAPRITYDAATGNALGLLVEEQRTNLALQSKDFTTTWIQNPNASVDVTSNATTAPDGTLTADKFIEADTALINHDLYQNFTFTAATTYTWSMFVKAAERSKGALTFGIQTAFTTERRVQFDLIAKTAVAAGAGATAGILEYPNGWFLVWVTATTDAAGASPYFVRLMDNSEATTYAGVVGSGLFISDAQLEVGANPSSRIPTTTAQVTRLADVISRALTTTNANAGAIFIDFDLTSYDKASGQATIVKLVDSGNSGNRGFGLVLSNNTFSAFIRNASANNSISVAVVDSLLPVKALVSFDNITLKVLVAINGVTNELTLGAPIDLTGFVSHLFLAGASVMSGTAAAHSKTVKRCTYVPRSFTAAEAQAITA